jgi:hypothetical protein
VLDSTRPDRQGRVFSDGVTLGSYRALRAGPRGAKELGTAFVAIHEGDLLAAIGQLVLRVERLERLVRNCRQSIGSGADAGAAE